MTNQKTSFMFRDSGSDRIGASELCTGSEKAKFPDFPSESRHHFTQTHKHTHLKVSMTWCSMTSSICVHVCRVGVGAAEEAWCCLRAQWPSIIMRVSQAGSETQVPADRQTHTRTCTEAAHADFHTVWMPHEGICLMDMCHSLFRDAWRLILKDKAAVICICNL